MKSNLFQMLMAAAVALLMTTGLATAQTVSVFYGLTSSGGGHNAGTIFKYYQSISPGAMDVFDFDTASSANSPGGMPFGSLVMGHDGNLYGLTQFGGSQGKGTIFKFNPANNTFTKLVDLTDSTGANPQGSFFLASDSNLYATAYQGGFYDYGTIFRYNIAANHVTKLWEFANDPDGANPVSNFIEDNGLLYATTSGGGLNNYGTLFHYNIANSTYGVDVNFDDVNLGQEPYGTPVLATNGKIYGASYNNEGSSWGVLYAFNPSASSCLPDYTFPETNNVGGKTYGNLMQAANGLIYGMTTDAADIFVFDPNTVTVANVYIFQSDNDGDLPYGGLIQASDNILYGMTSTGGSNSNGTIFKYDLSLPQFTVLEQLSGLTGDQPWGNLLQVGTINLTGVNTLPVKNLTVFPNPAQNYISIAGMDDAIAGNIRVTDITGKTVISQNLQPSLRINLNIQALEAGMYIIEVTQQNQIYEAKFCKSN
jgi:uncharacterized repeat protein (TIGR03803 family)